MTGLDSIPYSGPDMNHNPESNDSSDVKNSLRSGYYFILNEDFTPSLLCMVHDKIVLSTSQTWAEVFHITVLSELNTGSQMRIDVAIKSAYSNRCLVGSKASDTSRTTWSLVRNTMTNQRNQSLSAPKAFWLQYDNRFLRADYQKGAHLDFLNKRHSWCLYNINDDELAKVKASGNLVLSRGMLPAVAGPLPVKEWLTKRCRISTAFCSTQYTLCYDNGRTAFLAKTDTLDKERRLRRREMLVALNKSNSGLCRGGGTRDMCNNARRMASLRRKVMSAVVPLNDEFILQRFPEESSPAVSNGDMGQLFVLKVSQSNVIPRYVSSRIPRLGVASGVATRKDWACLELTHRITEAEVLRIVPSGMSSSSNGRPTGFLMMPLRQTAENECLRWSECGGISLGTGRGLGASWDIVDMEEEYEGVYEGDEVDEEQEDGRKEVSESSGREEVSESSETKEAQLSPVEAMQATEAADATEEGDVGCYGIDGVCGTLKKMTLDDTIAAERMMDDEATTAEISAETSRSRTSDECSTDRAPESVSESSAKTGDKKNKKKAKKTAGAKKRGRTGSFSSKELEFEIDEDGWAAI